MKLVFAAVLPTILLFADNVAASDAARDFALAERAFNAGDYRRAGEVFESVYRQKPHHAPLWNAARSWHRAGKYVRAANLLERYLHEAPSDAPDRERATAALADIMQRVGRIELQRANARDVVLDDVAIDKAVIYVVPGEHSLRATARDGSPVARHLSLGAGETASVSLAVVEKPASKEEPSPRSVERPAPQPKRLSPWFIAVPGGATMVAGTLSLGFGLTTISKRDAFRSDPTAESFADAHASQTATNVALAATGVFALATAAVAVYVLGWTERPRGIE